MKAFFLLVITGSALLAQAPAEPKAAPKSAPAKTGAGTAPKSGTTAAKSVSSRPNPALLNPAALKATAPELFRVKFTTTKGDFIVEVHRDWAPLGADRFYNLVRNRFFNDAAFFRWAVSSGKDFVVQFGIPASPAVAKAWDKATIKDEPVKEGNKKGTIVFAQLDGVPNSRTTQLFINLNDNAFLDKIGFAAFGTVTEGMEVVQSLYSGYGESPDQERITKEGKAYTDKMFPKLDLIKSTTVIFPEPATPAPKKAAPATKKATTPPPPAPPAKK